MLLQVRAGMGLGIMPATAIADYRLYLSAVPVLEAGLCVPFSLD